MLFGPDLLRAEEQHPLVLPDDDGAAVLAHVDALDRLLHEVLEQLRVRRRSRDCVPERSRHPEHLPQGRALAVLAGQGR